MGAYFPLIRKQSLFSVNYRVSLFLNVLFQDILGMCKEFSDSKKYHYLFLGEKNVTLIVSLRRLH